MALRFASVSIILGRIEFARTPVPFKSAAMESEASGAPKKPEITPLDRYSLVTNDLEAAKRVGDAFRRYFSTDRVQETGPTTAGEDFGSFGAEWGAPSVFWFVGGTDPDIYAKAKKEGKIGDIPTNRRKQI